MSSAGKVSCVSVAVVDQYEPCSKPVRLKIEIHKIHLICEIHIPKYRNPLQLSEIHCLKVEIHEIHVQTGIAKNRNAQNPHT